MTPTPSRTPAALLTILAALVLAATAVAALWVSSPDHNASGQCEGIGWGCTLAPRDLVAFATMFVGVPLALGTAGLAPVVVGLAERRRWLTSLGGVGLGLLALVVGVVGTLVLGGVLVLAAQLAGAL